MDYGMYLQKVDEFGLRKFLKGDPTVADLISDIGRNSTDLRTLIDSTINNIDMFERNSKPENVSEFDEGRSLPL
jgi:hypothetical protein